MFCGSTEAVRRVRAVSTRSTPGRGTITIAEYDFRDVRFGSLRVAILRDQPNTIQWSVTKFIDSWYDVALLLVTSRVRILGCPEFQTNEHPLIRELSKLVQTNIIQRGEGIEFPICVIGHVAYFKGNPRYIYTTVPSGKYTGGECMYFPMISNVTVRAPFVTVKRTVKSIISASGCCDRIQ